MNIRKYIKPDAGSNAIISLAREISTEPLVARLLLQRGISTPGEVEKFINPSLENLHNPFLMKDMEKAVARIDLAVSAGEKIMVFGDYDVDGTTGVSLFYSFLKNHFPNADGKKPDCSFYIPDRYSEGYGISIKGIDYAAENRFSLIIAIDCGIKSADKIKYARSKGIDFIICDHHLPGDDIPAASAILDPKQKNCLYPYKELTGCGIAYKFAQAILAKQNLPLSLLDPALDLVALSVAADIVPVTGENRILLAEGINRINTKPRPGIKALMDVGGLNRKVSTGEIVFVIAPRINAAGRIDSGRKSVELLTAVTYEDAAPLAKELNDDNSTRKDIDARTTIEAIGMIESDDWLLNAKSTVLFNPGWHKGVIGIVASRIQEKFYRPTILLTKSNGIAAGSARSVRDFDIYSAIESCSNLLEQFGGHKYAAGLTIKTENIDEFRKKFDEIVTGLISDEMLVPRIDIDAEISYAEISTELFRWIDLFAPYGPGNMRPVFETKGVFDTGYSRIVGNGHLKLKVFEPVRPALRFDCIAFDQAGSFNIVKSGQPFNITYYIDVNNWQGYDEIQLKVKHIEEGK